MNGETQGVSSVAPRTTASDQELMALLAEGKAEVAVRSIEDLSYEELMVLAGIEKGDDASVH